MGYLSNRLRGQLKFVYRILTGVRNSSALISQKNLVLKLSSFPDFPSSQSSQSQFIDLTLLGAKNVYAELLDLSGTQIVELMTIADFNVEMGHPEDSISNTLELLFLKYGSDKSSRHNYQFLYGPIIKSFAKDDVQIFEIGLGTNNTDTPSNMGRSGKPGASLRAWKELLPYSKIVGADLDKRVLFQEDGIETYYLDQTSNDAWVELKQKLNGRTFDLVIDDGLHAPIANLKTLKFGLSLLSDRGIMVIEDIHPRSLPIWTLALALQKSVIKYHMVQTKNALCLVMTKL
jgi:hypothetical protein